MNPHTTDTQLFSKFAELWWEPKGVLKTLHLINPIRLKYTDDVCQLANKYVLDVGCGGGIFSESMARLNARVTGIDISKDIILIAQEHAKQEGLDIEYISSTIEHFEYDADRKFDVITCMELLEHVESPESVIKSTAKLLRPGGDIIFSTINRNFTAYLQTIAFAEHISGLIPKDTHRYSQYIKPSEISRLLRNNSFKVINITGLKYVPIIDYVTLTDDISVNYLIHARYKE
jgi:2-polyprenyl-6-hydroxyphenyl methylase/3-demethylubiquinone-9 3-methyltransferase